MTARISYRHNQDLLQQRAETVLREGARLSAEDEDQLLGTCDASRFRGIVPLSCQLGTFHMLHLGDDYVAERLLWFGAFGYERCSAVTFTHLAERASLVLDLGTYTGYYSLLSAVLAKNTATYGVEANPLNFHRTSENLRINGVDVTIANRAVIPAGEDRETVDLRYNAGLAVLDAGGFAVHEQAESMSYKQRKEDTFTVRAQSLPSLLTEWNVDLAAMAEAMVLVKVDVEGLEAPLVKDALELFVNNEVCLFVEILNPEVYEAIWSLVQTRDDLGLAYIDEYNQEITLQSSDRLHRTKGSRNFIVGSTTILESVVGSVPSSLLATYE